MNLAHYIKSIIKNMRKSGKSTVFNLIGISVSFAAFLLLSIYIYNEFTYDYSNEKIDRIYRLNMVAENQGEKIVSSYLPNPMADLILENVPELQNLCSFSWSEGTFNKDGDEINTYSVNTRAVDSTFTEIFTLKMKYGPEHPLKGQGKIILSESAAKRIYGNENPVGKTIFANFTKPYEISGVYYDQPENTTFRHEAFCSYPTDFWVYEWTEYSFNHYYLIAPGADFEQINEKIKQITGITEHMAENNDYKVNFSFTPMTDIHFDKETETGNISFVYTLVAVALLLVFMAFVNFINFAIANVPKLLKAANIRRVVGESRQKIVLLFITEAVLLMLVSFIIAFFINILTINFWPDIFGYPINLWDHWPLMLILLLFLSVFGAVASIYPAMLIVSVKPAMALKGLITFSAKSGTPGKVLTVIQYAISIILIIAVLFIELQINYAKHFDLGFQKENILVLNTTPEIQKQERAFADEMKKSPYITDYAFSQFVPGGVGMSWGREVDGKQVSFRCWPVDERYLNFMGLSVIDGRMFSENLKTDENSFIFNEKALKEFGWTENYLGKEIPGFDFTGKLIGVVKDLKYASLHEEVMPMAFWLTSERHNKMSLKIDGAHIKEAMEHVQKVYDQFEPKYAIHYFFLDENLDKLYKAEEKQAQLIFIFSMISIIISVVGALGLIIFISEYRIKEIGVRKVNGATTGEIVYMLNWSLLKWVVLAFFIAIPIAWLLMDWWLQSFAYRISLSWWVFLLAGVIALLIAMITVSRQSFKAARRNPVEALRYE